MEDEPNEKKKQSVPTASGVIDDGTLIELVFQPKHRQTIFAVYDAGRGR